VEWLLSMVQLRISKEKMVECCFLKIIYQTPSEISEILANNYSKISANSNYDSTFITRKLLAEKNSSDFSPHYSPTNLMYNSPITEHEVISIISEYSKTSIPGFDQISSIMLHNLHLYSICYFTSLLNRILLFSFPSMWKMAVVVPLLKPLKGPSLPSPIVQSLSSACFAKFSKEFSIADSLGFSKREILSHSQYVCRKGSFGPYGTSRSRHQHLRSPGKKIIMHTQSFFIWRTHSRAYGRTILYQLAFPAPLQPYFKITYRTAPSELELTIIIPEFTFK